MDEIQNPKSLINRDYEQIPLVSFDEWIESPERHSRLGVGIIIEPKDDIYLIKDQLEFIELIALDSCSNWLNRSINQNGSLLFS